jgi:hypothetical protein
MDATELYWNTTNITGIQVSGGWWGIRDLSMRPVTSSAASTPDAIGIEFTGAIFNAEIRNIQFIVWYTNIGYDVSDTSVVAHNLSVDNTYSFGHSGIALNLPPSTGSVWTNTYIQGKRVPGGGGAEVAQIVVGGVVTRGDDVFHMLNIEHCMCACVFRALGTQSVVVNRMHLEGLEPQDSATGGPTISALPSLIQSSTQNLIIDGLYVTNCTFDSGYIAKYYVCEVTNDSFITINGLQFRQNDGRKTTAGVNITTSDMDVFLFNTATGDSGARISINQSSSEITGRLDARIEDANRVTKDGIRNRVFVSAETMVAVVGTPTRTTVGTTVAHASWRFGTAAQELVSAPIPREIERWGTYDVYFYAVPNVGSGTGNAVLQGDIIQISDGDTVNGATTAMVGATVAPPTTQYQLQRVTMTSGTPLNNAIEQFRSFRIGRNGASGSDTYNQTLDLIGILFQRVT